MQQTALIKELLPVLKKSLRKGDCGKIGVIGGSAEYTGAPYFSAITPMKIGADLTFVYTHPAAAPVIKSYSPELIVYPNQDFEANRQSIEKLDALVFGPGLGREEHTVELLHKVIEFAKKAPTICVVIDADGLFYIKDCFKQLAECDDNLVITPNHREFARLFEYVFPGKKVEEKHLGDQTKQLAAKLGVVVVRKGETDMISDGHNLEVCGSETSLRRCGGQGDILSGAIALFAYWAKRKGSIGEEKIGKKPQQNEGKQQPPASSQPYSAKHLMDGALAATQLIRRTSLETYRRIGRSMTAADIVDSIPAVIQEIDYTQPGTSMFIV